MNIFTIGWRKSVLTWRPRVFVILYCFVAVLNSGCGGGEAGMGQVTGTVKVDGQIPAVGSSITFFPVDGNSRSAGDVLESGNYSVAVPQGEARVEIRIPKPVPADSVVVKQGPGLEAESGQIMESLPPKYNDQSELRMNVVAGPNKKDWEVSTK